MSVFVEYPDGSLVGITQLEAWGYVVGMAEAQLFGRAGCRTVFGRPEGYQKQGGPWDGVWVYDP